MPPVPAPTHPEEPEAPKKPHREATRPKPVQRPESPTPPPPPPPPIVATRPLDRTQIHALLDSEVARRNGKVIGRAVDMVTDASGKPREMIVNLQGFMGVGDRKVIFPWNVFASRPVANRNRSCSTCRRATSRRPHGWPACPGSRLARDAAADAGQRRRAPERHESAASSTC